MIEGGGWRTATKKKQTTKKNQHCESRRLSHNFCFHLNHEKSNCCEISTESQTLKNWTTIGWPSHVGIFRTLLPLALENAFLSPTNLVATFFQVKNEGFYPLYDFHMSTFSPITKNPQQFFQVKLPVATSIEYFKWFSHFYSVLLSFKAFHCQLRPESILSATLFEP